jgi:Fur family zinc uptake transcriptional regulator
MVHSHLVGGREKLADSLREAERLCRQRGGKLTRLRKTVLMLLLQSERPTKAYDLIQRLGDAGAANPATIYRALDFLVNMALVHRIESLNSFVACRHPKHSHSAIFLICDCCGSVTEMDGGESSEKLGRQVEGMEFRMRDAVVEVRGLCRDCVLR